MNELIKNQPELESEKEKPKLDLLFERLNEASLEIKKRRGQMHPYNFTDFYKNFKKTFNQDYPDCKKIVETTFGINGFVRSHENFNYHKEALVPEQQKKELINLATWQYKATEVLIEMGWNHDQTKKFWQQIESFFKIFSNHPEDFEGYKRGITGQAKAFLILQELGYNPRLATPKEDVFEGTDFYISYPGRNENLRTQIKFCSLKGESTIELVDCGFPGVVIEEKNERQTRFETQYMDKMFHVRQNCGKISQKEGKQIKSLLIYLNENDFDPITGRSTQSFLEKIKKELEKKLT